MEGQRQLKKCTLSVAFSKDVDPVIDWVNTPWSVKANPEELIKTATVKYAENGIKIILEFNTIEAYLCDDSGGEPKLFTLIGAEVGASE